jgi:hypothetical protein
MQEANLAIEWWPLDRPRPYDGNPRIISAVAIEKVARSIQEFGWRQPIVVDEQGVIIVGHTRLLAAKHLQLDAVPIHIAALSPERATAYRLADNRVGEESTWDLPALGAEIGKLEAVGFDLAPLGFDPGDFAGLEPEPSAGAPQDGGRLGSLVERFGVAPFSVLNAREGWWQDRKRAWLALGIRSELGRGAAPGGSPRPLDRAKAKRSLK